MNFSIRKSFTKSFSKIFRLISFVKVRFCHIKVIFLLKISHNNLFIIFLFFYFSICLSVYFFICLSVHFVFFYFYICLSVYFFLYLTLQHRKRKKFKNLQQNDEKKKKRKTYESISQSRHVSKFSILINWFANQMRN